MGALSYVGESLYHEQAAGRAAPTRRNHRRALERLSDWLEAERLSEREVRSRDLVRFVNMEGIRCAVRRSTTSCRPFGCTSRGWW